MQLENNNHSSDRFPEVRLGSKIVGSGRPCYVTAEIGINHNGDIDIAKKLISVAVGAGCDAVKFQKRTIDIVYSAEELAKPRESPFGNTNGDLKRGLEFEFEEYREIDRYCREVKIDWYASCWDEASVDLIAKFNVPCLKIASASLTDDNLLRHTRATGKPIILSTGMSTIEEINRAVVGHALLVEVGMRHLVGNRLVGHRRAEQLQRPVVGRVLRVPVRRLTYSTTDEDDS